RRQAALEPAVPARRTPDHRRPLAGRLSLLSGGGIRLRHPRPAQEYRGLARPRQSAAELEASLRPDAGASAAGPLITIARRRRHIVPSPACGGGKGRGHAMIEHFKITPSPALPRRWEREQTELVARVESGCCSPLN